MKMFLITSAFFGFTISILSSILLVKLITLVKDNTNVKSYVKFAVTKINQARYGNFQIKFSEKRDRLQLYKSLNDLFESIYDRDLVISEYRQNEKENYALKEEFIAALTHDLKVPIIAQHKTFDLFLAGKFGKLTDNQKEVIQKLRESNSELKEMVNSILETYKAENKGIEIKIEKDIQVKKFLIDCIEELKAVAIGKELNFYSKAEDFSASFDPVLIKRVINNLVSNAIYHSKTKDKIDIHLNKTGDTFSIDVIDYGEGIDEDEITKIFNKYYSITGKGKKLSTGLGLYVSDKIVKKHNGVIEVESKKGEGSIFRIILPVELRNEKELKEELPGSC